MHLSIILMAIGIAVLTRLYWSKSPVTWADRWELALGAFLFPPILLLMTGIIVLGMGHHGTMLRHPVGWMGCHIALGFLSVVGVSLACLFGQQWRSLQQVRSLQLTTIASRPGRVLETPALFAAQVGIWNPQLVVSRGLLQSLKEDQVEAVLSHEEAHSYYRDTFYFFWLSWIRQLTFWLPKTESLWEELLLLREIRADYWAAQRVDALTLAETLLLVVRSASVVPNQYSTAFHNATPVIHLEERIEFLITQLEVSDGKCQVWFWLIPVLIPMLIVPLHS